MMFIHPLPDPEGTPAHPRLPARFTTVILLALLLAAGCTTHRDYYMLTRSGTVLHSVTKPDKKKGTYRYEDARGRGLMIPADQVLEIKSKKRETDWGESDRFRNTFEFR